MVDGWKLLWNPTTNKDLHEGGDWTYWTVNPFQVMRPPWPKDGNDADVDMTVLVSIHQEKYSKLPIRRCVQSRYVIRRYSLIAPGVYDDIVNASFDESFDGGDDWWPGGPMYVTDNIVAIGCHKKRSDKIRIVLIDINTKSYQFLETTSPKKDAVIRSIVKGPSNDDLSILFQVDNWPHDTTFYVADYVMTPTDSVRSPIIHQTASRQLAWAQGMWRFDSMFGSKYFPPFGFPGIFYGMNHYTTDLTPRLLASHVVSFDRHGFHDMGAANDWMRKFERTPVGLRMVEAKQSYVNQVPPLPQYSIIPFHLHRSHLFVGGNGKPFFHRPLSPPSRSYIVAEDLCLANPGFDFARLEDMIGFDAFDGIYDGKPPIDIQM